MDVIPFSPVDYIFTGPGSQPITFAFEFDGKINIKHLEESFLEAVKIFPIVSSTIVKTDEISYAYKPGKEGLDFKVIVKEISLTDTEILGEFITPVNSIPGHPLSAVRITQTSDKTIVALSISHALVDGFSYFHFLTTWARIARNEKYLPPILQRELVHGNHNTIEHTVDPDYFSNATGVFMGPERTGTDLNVIEKKRIKLSKKEIQELLKMAYQPDGPKVTANDVITAWLWKQYAPSWFQEGEVYISCPFDFRGILPDIPRTYFGCAILCASTSVNIDTLMKMDFKDITTMIRLSINEMTTEKLHNGLSVMKKLRETQGITAMEKVHVRHPSIGMIVTNLSRMPLVDVDFGSGPPENFIAHSDIDHGAAILPAKDGVEILVYE